MVSPEMYKELLRPLIQRQCQFLDHSHYHLKEDIGETRNLADSEPEKRSELSAKLTAWQEEIEALIPEPNPDYVPWEEREPSGHCG